MTVPAPDTVVMFSTADWRERYWTNKQHTALRLAERGSRVLYIESIGLRRPGANQRDLDRIASRLERGVRPPERVHENIWLCAPLAIPFAKGAPLVQRLNGRLLRAPIRAWLSRNGRSRPVVWTYHPYVDEAVSGTDCAAVVYHCVDDIAAIPGVDAESFRLAEDSLLRRADLVFVTSTRLRDRCASIAGDRVHYERNVADIEHFSAARKPGPVPAEIAALPAGRLIYVGVLSAFKLDLPLIEACVAARPDLQWIFIGEEPERQRSAVIQRMARQPNFHLLGYRPYADLPGYLRGADIALLPNLIDGYMASVFPMKVYEYLAAGRPIVSTHLPALKEIDAPPLSRASTPAEWIAAIDRELAKRATPLDLTDPRLAQFGWDVRLDRMLEKLSTSSLQAPLQRPRGV